MVGLNSDLSVKKLKGKNRPINNEKNRAEILAALSCIDFVSIFNEDTAEKFLEMVKPNTYVKGGEYNVDILPEAQMVKKHGGEIFLVPMIPDSSTTTLLDKIKKN